MRKSTYCIILLLSIAASIGAAVTGAETFQRTVLVPEHAARRFQLAAYLSDPRPVVALGSSQMNMSLNIDRPDFFNAAWRGETIDEQWLRLRIMLRKSPGTIKEIFVEVNAPIMASPGTGDRFYYYADLLTDGDLAIIRKSGVPYQLPILTQFAGPYRRDMLKLFTSYLEGRSLAPNPVEDHFMIRDNGYSYNIIANHNFPEPIQPSGDLIVQHHFDFYLRQILAEAKTHGIRVTLISTPMFPTLRAALAASPHDETKSYIRAIAAQYGLRYFNFSAFSDDPTDFWNEDHMSLKGATRFGRYAAPILFAK